MSRPLGGFGPVNRGGFARGARPNQGYPGYGYGYPYAYSFYVPDYFDYSGSSEPYPGANPYAPAYYAPPAPVAAPEAPQQPIIINQYFGTSDPQQASTPVANTTNAQAPGDPIGTPQNYYLIAYKNHTVYSALAYWVEGKTLNYVTMQNTHNQASLDLIDLPLTKSLNQDRAVPFSIPGQ